MVGDRQTDGVAVEPAQLIERLTAQTFDRGKKDPELWCLAGRGRHIQGSPPQEIKQTAFCLMHASVLVLVPLRYQQMKELP